MKTITIGSTIVRFDDEDEELVLEHSWSVDNQGYIKTNIKRASYYGYTTKRMHQLILGYTGFIDHIDGDKGNNQKQNLRVATRSQNGANRGKLSNNTSGYKGVTYEVSRKKYTAQITHQRRVIRIGRYATAEEAAKAYDLKAKELQGDFACINFP